MNTLGANDLPGVDGAYRGSRRALIEAGAELHELRTDAAVLELQDTPPAEAAFIALHKKILVIDRRLVYVGSLDFDPSSESLYTEMGVVIESPPLAEAVITGLERDMRPENCWRVTLDVAGRLTWTSGDETTNDRSAWSSWRRFRNDVYSILPIDGHL